MGKGNHRAVTGVMSTVDRLVTKSVIKEFAGFYQIMLNVQFDCSHGKKCNLLNWLFISCQRGGLNMKKRQEAHTDNTFLHFVFDILVFCNQFFIH